MANNSNNSGNSSNGAASSSTTTGGTLSGTAKTGSPKVVLTSDHTDLASNSIAKLTFTFSAPPTGFTLDDLKVTNGAVTGLARDAINPNIYTAMFLGGVTDRSGMSTIEVAGDYSDALGTRGTPSNTLTIKNVDRAITSTVGFVSNNISVTEGNDGTKMATVTLTLSSAVTNEVSVAYTTDKQTFGTAKAGQDFVSTTGTVVFAPGETTKTISVPILGDKIYESNENFYIDLLSAKGANIVTNGAEGLKNSWVSVNIVNDDVAPQPTVGFATNNVSIVEGNDGVKTYQVTVTLSAPGKEAVAVDYTTDNKPYGTATANIDYVPAKGTLVFAAGETSKTISLGIVGDKTYEANETFYLDLVSAKGANVVTNGAEGLKSSWMAVTIQNDDINSKPTLSFATNNASVVEGNDGTKVFQVSVSLSAPATGQVSVDYTTENRAYGTAKANTDYVPTTGTLVFAPGETSKTISVAIVGDTAYEANETFYLDLLSANGANVVTNGAEGLKSSWMAVSINNDDLANAANQVGGVYGTTGIDKLGGTAHDDLIDGRGGADTITGYSGNDVFALAAGYATRDYMAAARILDFTNGTDHIGLRGNLNFTDLVISDSKTAEGATLSLATGETLAVLVGVKASMLDASDFFHLAA